MNLDDFIVPSSIGTPAGISPAPSSIPEDFPSSGATVTAQSIPIKQHRRLQEEELPPVRASAPSVAPSNKGRGGEFNYVQRHVRKTSVDERRVSWTEDVVNLAILTFRSLASAVRKPPLKFRP